MTDRKRTNKMPFMDLKMVYSNLPFLLFLALIGVIYIANAHLAERKVRKIQSLQREIERSKWKYWEAKSPVMYDGIQSQTEKRVEDIGLKSEHRNIEVIVADEPEDDKKEVD